MFDRKNQVKPWQQPNLDYNLYLSTCCQLQTQSTAIAIAILEALFDILTD